jgi:hypothetical protein
LPCRRCVVLRGFSWAPFVLVSGVCVGVGQFRRFDGEMRDAHAVAERSALNFLAGRGGKRRAP